MMMRLLKVCLELDHLSIINNEYAPKNGDDFWKKTMKAYFKAVMISLKIYKNIPKFSFLMGVIRHTDCLPKFFKAVIYRCRGVVILYTD